MFTDWKRGSFDFHWLILLQHGMLTKNTQREGKEKLPSEEELGRKQKECSSAHFKVLGNRRKLTPSWLHKAHTYLSPTTISKRNKCQSKSERSEHESSLFTTACRAIPVIYYSLYSCQRGQCSSLEMLAMSGRWSSYRKTVFGVVVGEDFFLFLQIVQVRNNQKKNAGLYGCSCGRAQENHATF